MAKNEAYRIAEEKIEEALRTGAEKLDLSARWDALETLSLSQLPDSVGQLTQLKSLDLSRNKLTSLPESLEQLKQLQSLNLNQNHLTVLAESLGQLTQLQSLNINQNQLTALPESLGRLTQLQSLNVTQNQLTALPESLAQLTQLQSLGISHNQLTSLPEWLGQLTQLQSLGISHNQLTSLPEWLGKLTQLQSLGISNNRLTALPESLGQLSQLRSLGISNNRLMSLPESLGQLVRLRLLNLNNNQLTALPESLGQLTQLQSLKLVYNRLTGLPESLGHLLGIHGLQFLELTSNPLNPELNAAYEEGLDSVVRYLRAKAAAQVVFNEAKLILVGEGEVGKSCLLAALRGDPWVEGRVSTHGIEIKSVKVAYPGTGTEITLNGWDFGGQRVYRPTHQLFFSAPAVYLVVWKPREGPQQGFVKEWIRLIRHREPEAKILVVATHGGPKERQPEIDRQELWDLFGRETVIDFFHVDSRLAEVDANGGESTGACLGIKALRVAIGRVAASLPEMGRTVPKQWQEAREALKKRAEAYLPLSQVLAICQEHKLEEADARLLLRICRSVGDLIHYEHDPLLRDIVVLKPDWLATAISFVLDDKETRETGHGLVSFERLGKLWDDPLRPAENRYPAELHAVFRRLMERFDLCYRVTDAGRAEAGETSLIAQLVPDVRPDKVAGWDDAPAEGDEEQVQICRIVDASNHQSASAEGLFYQLIVRLHKYSLGRADYRKSSHWQRGLVLEDDTGARAFLEHAGNDVRITVRSPWPQRFLSALTFDVEWLVESFWEGLRCDVTVPCLRPSRDGALCKGLFEVSKLIENKRRKRKEQPCPVCNEWQGIDELLNNAPAARPNPIEQLLAHSQEVKQTLNSVRSQLAENQVVVIGRFDHQDAETRRLVSKVEDAYTHLIKTLLDEGKDGPRLFSLEPLERSRFNPNGWVNKEFRLTLWCEHARVPLPWLNPDDPKKGEYEFDVPRDWFVKAAPFLKGLAATLSMVLPVAAPALKLGIGEEAFKAMEDHLDLGKECAEAMLTGTEKMTEWGEQNYGPDLEGEGWQRAGGSAMRELHAWLKERDPGFGGLVRVQNKRQEFMWVHPQFEGEY